MLQSVIYKYNYPPYKNLGLKLNINKINNKFIWNNQIGKPGIYGIFITTLNYCLLFHFYLFPVLLSYYIPANLLIFQRCWHIKINLLSALIYLIRLRLIKFQVYMLQFYLIFWFSRMLLNVLKNFQKAVKCNYLFI